MLQKISYCQNSIINSLNDGFSHDASHQLEIERAQRLESLNKPLNVPPVKMPKFDPVIPKQKVYTIKEDSVQFDASPLEFIGVIVT